MIKSFSLQSTLDKETIDITDFINKAVQESDIEEGMAFIFVPHTTAALTIIENADPDVQKDLLYKLKELVPRDSRFFHFEGNSDAHILSSLIGSSITVPIENHALWLGRWQGIFLVELDGPKKREVGIRLVRA
ncbi:secondary thiamine-phosphate synthase enzyme YjbQ [bacterium]|nr:secondary thiamine-phosphate synthase enzyme YjbQ [bacterium]